MSKWQWLGKSHFRNEPRGRECSKIKLSDWWNNQLQGKMMHVSIWLLVSVTDVIVDASIQKSPSLTLYKSVRALFLKSCTGNFLKENIRKDHINRSYHLTSEGKGEARIPGSLALTDFITSHIPGSLPELSKPKTQTRVVSCAGSRSPPTTGS